jgi:hypothetical protein
MLILDPPKAGKSAFLQDFLPYLILESYPTSKTLHIDFVKSFNINVEQEDSL